MAALRLGQTLQQRKAGGTSDVDHLSRLLQAAVTKLAAVSDAGPEEVQAVVLTLLARAVLVACGRKTEPGREHGQDTAAAVRSLQIKSTGSNGAINDSTHGAKEDKRANAVADVHVRTEARVSAPVSGQVAIKSQTACTTPPATVVHTAVDSVQVADVACGCFGRRRGPARDRGRNGSKIAPVPPYTASGTASSLSTPAAAGASVINGHMGVTTPGAASSHADGRSFEDHDEASRAAIQRSFTPDPIALPTPRGDSILGPMLRTPRGPTPRNSVTEHTDTRSSEPGGKVSAADSTAVHDGSAADHTAETMHCSWGDHVTGLCAGAAAVATAVVLGEQYALRSDGADGAGDGSTDALPRQLLSLVLELEGGPLKKPQALELAPAPTAQDTAHRPAALAAQGQQPSAHTPEPALQPLTSILHRAWAAAATSYDPSAGGGQPALSRLADVLDSMHGAAQAPTASPLPPEKRRAVVSMCQAIQRACCTMARTGSSDPARMVAWAEARCGSQGQGQSQEQLDDAPAVDCPAAVSEACHAPALSSALSAVISALWRGDPSASPPDAGLALGCIVSVLGLFGLVDRPAAGQTITSATDRHIQQLQDALRLLDGRATSLILPPLLRQLLDDARTQATVSSGQAGQPAALPAAGANTRTPLRLLLDRTDPLPGLIQAVLSSSMTGTDCIPSSDQGRGLTRPWTGTARVVHPTFTRAVGGTGGDAGAAAADIVVVAAAAGDTTIEDGEGHGPRKEALGLCLEAVVSHTASPEAAHVQGAQGSDPAFASKAEAIHDNAAPAVRRVPLFTWRKEAEAHWPVQHAEGQKAAGGEKKSSAVSGASPISTSDATWAVGWLLASAPLVSRVHVPLSVLKPHQAMLAFVMALGADGGHGQEQHGEGQAQPLEHHRHNQPLSLSLHHLLSLDPAGYRQSLEGVWALDVHGMTGLLELEDLSVVQMAAAAGGASQGTGSAGGGEGRLVVVSSTATGLASEVQQHASVTSSNLHQVKSAYTAHLIRHLVVWQAAGHADDAPGSDHRAGLTTTGTATGSVLGALAQGFGSALGGVGLSTLRCLGLSSHDVALLLCGADDDSYRQAGPGTGGGVGAGLAASDGGPAGKAARGIRHYFRVIQDPELTSSPLLQAALWAVLDSWPLSKQRRFLHFITGSPAWPVPGSEVLRVVLPYTAFTRKEKAELLARLPVAHTCSNTLEIPNYLACLRAVYAGDGSAGAGAGAGSVQRCTDLPPELQEPALGPPLRAALLHQHGQPEVSSLDAWLIATAVVLEQRLETAMWGSEGYALDEARGRARAGAGAAAQGVVGPASGAAAVPAPRTASAKLEGSSKHGEESDSDDEFLASTRPKARVASAAGR